LGPPTFSRSPVDQARKRGGNAELVEPRAGFVFARVEDQPTIQDFSQNLPGDRRLAP
jgi:hypothetical protein